jgi:hypothetical protein
MISSSNNDLYYSACLYLQHQIEQRGAAFRNHSGYYYKVEDRELPNLNVYALPFKSLIYDHSISGATIPTGVWVNSNYVVKNQSGLIAIDYINSRAIFSGGSTYSNLSVSGRYAIKDFNIWPSTKSDEELIFETKYQLNPSYNRGLSGIDKNALVVPGIFITNLNTENEILAFGGLLENTTNIHCVILADSKDQLDAVGGLLADEKYSSFPVFSKTPLNYYGDYKSGNYNYIDYIGPTSGQNLAFIDDASFYRLSSKDFSDKYPDLKAGFCEFHCKMVKTVNRSIY